MQFSWVLSFNVQAKVCLIFMALVFIIADTMIEIFT